MAGQSDRWNATARMLRRIGFGITGPQVDAVARQSWPHYVDATLNANPDTDPGALATPMPTPPMTRVLGQSAPAAMVMARDEQVVAQIYELGDWWWRRMVAVHQPVHEKLTLLWHNHFATSSLKVWSAAFMAAQNRKLRNLSLGDFRTLAYSMLTDAAMIAYLDAHTSTAAAPNENLAREFMELFALGHGDGYTEVDVREGARALTGWVVLPTGKTTVMPTRHDGATKTLFGVTKKFDAAGFCDAVLAQPKSPTYVAGRLWQQLASDTPPSRATLDRLVSAYGPGRNLRALTRAVLTDDEFVNGGASIVNTPVEWLAGVVRTLKVPTQTPTQVRTMQSTLAVLGQQPFFPPNVGGWPHGRVWMSTASAGLRMRVAHQLASTGDLSTVEGATANARIDAVGYLIGVGAWSDRTVAALKPLVRNPAQLVAAAVNTPEYLTS